MMRVLSLGAGVQSTAMALMAAHGEITPMPDCALFADTGAEPAAVYEHLNWLRSPNVLPFPIHIVSAGNIADDLRKGFSNIGGQSRFAGAPFFIKRVKENGSFEQALGRRQCTRHYKIDVLARKQRELLGVARGVRVPAGTSMEVWIGISLDEAIRAKHARHRWQINRHPLLELRMRRVDCLEWIEQKGYPRPPKSACYFCPFMSDDRWRESKKQTPEEFEKACQIDELVRSNGAQRGWKNKLFVHRSLIPLREVDLSTPAERGQSDLFNNECEGMCGV